MPAALRRQPPGLARHQRQGDEHGAARRHRAEWAGPADQHVEHGDDQGDGGREHRPDGEPLQTLPIVPDRAGVTEPHAGCSAHDAPRSTS